MVASVCKRSKMMHGLQSVAKSVIIEVMVTVYTTPTCVFCKAVKEWLTGKKVEFKEVDLTEDQQAAQWVLHNTGQLAVPVTRFDDNTIVIGFDRPRLEAALAK